MCLLDEGLYQCAEGGKSLLSQDCSAGYYNLAQVSPISHLSHQPAVMDTTKQLRLVLSSVVEPFHFGPAPAPASRDGGSRSSSSSSPVVHNWLLKKRKFEKFHFSIYRDCFIHRNVRVLCSSSTLLKGQINFISHC